MGDFSADFNLPSTGIHTIEGNVAGSRAATLTKKRQEAQAEFQTKKQKIIHENQRLRQSIDTKFNGNSGLTVADQIFRSKTVGLVSAKDFKAAQEESKILAKKRQQGLLLDDDDDDCNNDAESGKASNSRQNIKDDKKLEKKKQKEMKKLKKKKKKMLNQLSFANEDDAQDFIDNVDDDDEASQNETKNSPSSSTATTTMLEKEIKKNPFVNTSFLPDKEREAQLKAQKQKLKNEWITQQTQIKKELLEITYSYWDGSGHRREVTCTKGSSIGQFLEIVRKDLAKDFREMQNVSSDALVYVKEDLIIPQDVTFYDLIVTKARGKSGPLFNFDVHDDVRVGAIDSRVEKDESHPGKVVERRWYDRNKHIFPASRWELFDPAKEYGRYTIHGDEVAKKKK